MNIPLDVGFRFLPPDEEIINFFLWYKMIGRNDLTRHIREVVLLQHEPWDMPALSVVPSRYREWHFFYKLNKISEQKSERVTQAGFWKSTDQEWMIGEKGRVIGTKKTLVFYKGRTPRGVKTDWVMYEFRATPDFIPPNAENNYVVGLLRNEAAERTENSTSNDCQPNTHLAASTSQNNAVAVTPVEVAPQLQSNSMDFELALQTQMEDQGIFDCDLPSSVGLLEFNLASSSGLANNDQNMMEEEGISLEDLPPPDDFDDYEPDECQFHDIIDWEREFRTPLFPPDQDGLSYEETLYPLHPDFRAPDYPQSDHIGFMSDGTAHGHSEGFNQRRMENGFHHDEILVMDSSVDSATVTTYQINCLESVQEERSVNSRACKSQYEPRPHRSVVQGPPKRVQLQGKSAGKAVTRDKTRESGGRGPVVELVRNKKSIVQSNKDPKMDRDRKTKSDSNSSSNGSAGSSRKHSLNFVEMSQLSCEPNPPIVYVGNVLLGVILFIVIVGQLMFLH